MRITKLALATLAALGLCLASACDDAKTQAKDGKAEAKQDAKAADAKVADAKAADAKAADAKVADAGADDAKADAGAAAGAAAGAIGVPECDEYVTKMSECIAAGTVAAAERDAQQMSLDMSTKTWADAMKANPEGGSALVGGCKAAIDMGRVKYPTCFPAQ
jgi:Meckel syndrome type 1 protein